MLTALLFAGTLAQNCDSAYNFGRPKGLNDGHRVAAAPFTSDVWSLGTMSAVEGGFKLRNWRDDRWQEWEKGALDLTVKPNGMPVIIDVNGATSALTMKGKWKSISSSCTTQIVFSVKRKAAYKLGCSLERYRPHKIYKANFKLRTWKQITKAGAESIAIDNNDRLYIVNRQKLFSLKYGAKKWKSMKTIPTGLQKVVAGPKKNQLYVLADYVVHKLVKGKWQHIYSHVKDFSIGRDGRLHIVTLDGEIFWSDCKAEKQSDSDKVRESVIEEARKKSKVLLVEEIQNVHKWYKANPKYR